MIIVRMCVALNGRCGHVIKTYVLCCYTAKLKFIESAIASGGRFAYVRSN